MQNITKPGYDNRTVCSYALSIRDLTDTMSITNSHLSISDFSGYQSRIDPKSGLNPLLSDI